MLRSKGKSFYVVYVGPFKTLQAVHQLASTTHNHPQATSITHTQSSSIDASATKSAHHHEKQVEQVPSSTQYVLKMELTKRLSVKIAS